LRWYAKLHRESQEAPPAYLVERISDLCHAVELMGTSPREARAVLDSVARRLRQQGDEEMAGHVEVAIKKSNDSPLEAKDMVTKVMILMEALKEEQDKREKSPSWKLRKK